MHACIHTYIHTGRKHQLERLLSFQDRTDAKIAYMYRHMKKIRSQEAAHEGQLNASIAQHRGWHKVSYRVYTVYYIRESRYYILDTICCMLHTIN